MHHSHFYRDQARINSIAEVEWEFFFLWFEKIGCIFSFKSFSVISWILESSRSSITHLCFTIFDLYKSYYLSYLSTGVNCDVKQYLCKHIEWWRKRVTSSAGRPPCFGEITFVTYNILYILTLTSDFVPLKVLLKFLALPPPVPLNLSLIDCYSTLYY